jgi:hypothetical protein
VGDGDALNNHLTLATSWLDAGNHSNAVQALNHFITLVTSWIPHERGTGVGD